MSFFTRMLKEDPYHDAQGRFTSAGNEGHAAPKPSKSLYPPKDQLDAMHNEATIAAIGLNVPVGKLNVFADTAHDAFLNSSGKQGFVDKFNQYLADHKGDGKITSDQHEAMLKAAPALYDKVTGAIDAVSTPVQSIAQPAITPTPTAAPAKDTSTLPNAVQYEAISHVLMTGIDDKNIVDKLAKIVATTMSSSAITGPFTFDTAMNLNLKEAKTNGELSSSGYDLAVSEVNWNKVYTDGQRTFALSQQANPEPAPPAPAQPKAPDYNLPQIAQDAALQAYSAVDQAGDYLMSADQKAIGQLVSGVYALGIPPEATAAKIKPLIAAYIKTNNLSAKEEKGLTGIDWSQFAYSTNKPTTPEPAAAPAVTPEFKKDVVAAANALGLTTFKGAEKQKAVGLIAAKALEGATTKQQFLDAIPAAAEQVAAKYHHNAITIAQYKGLEFDKMWNSATWGKAAPAAPPAAAPAPTNMNFTVRQLEQGQMAAEEHAYNAGGMNANKTAPIGKVAEQALIAASDFSSFKTAYEIGLNKLVDTGVINQGNKADAMVGAQKIYNKAAFTPAGGHTAPSPTPAPVSVPVAAPPIDATANSTAVYDHVLAAAGQVQLPANVAIKAAGWAERAYKTAKTPQEFVTNMAAALHDPTNKNWLTGAETTKLLSMDWKGAYKAGGTPVAAPAAPAPSSSVTNSAGGAAVYNKVFAAAANAGMSPDTKLAIAKIAENAYLAASSSTDFTNKVKAGLDRALDSKLMTASEHSLAVGSSWTSVFQHGLDASLAPTPAAKPAASPAVIVTQTPMAAYMETFADTIGLSKKVSQIVQDAAENAYAMASSKDGFETQLGQKLASLVVSGTLNGASSTAILGSAAKAYKFAETSKNYAASQAATPAAPPAPKKNYGPNVTSSATDIRGNCSTEGFKSYDGKHDELGALMHQRKLTGSEKSALKDYKGHGYDELNGQLRQNRVLSHDVTDKVIALGTATTAGVIPAGTLIYRGVNSYEKPFGSMAALQDAIKTGGGHLDHGFISCSTSKAFSDSWGGGGSKAVLFELKLTKDTPAVHVALGKGQSANDDGEYEVVLPRSTLWRVVGMRYDKTPNFGKKLIVTMEST
jgi:hypothetical protein